MQGILLAKSPLVSDGVTTSHLAVHAVDIQRVHRCPEVNSSALVVKLVAIVFRVPSSSSTGTQQRPRPSRPKVPPPPPKDLRLRSELFFRWYGQCL